MKQRTFDVGRISGLGDGVFAIAMTLLVLDLKLPDLGTGLSREAFSAALAEQAPRFVSWLLSFAILCRLWITHHALLAEGERRTRGFVFLGAVSFIPFPTSLLSEHHDQPLSVIVFSLTLVAAGIALLGMHREVRRTRPAGNEAGRGHERPVVFLLVTAVLAGILAVFEPAWGLTAWIVFPFVAVVIGKRASSLSQQDG